MQLIEKQERHENGRHDREVTTRKASGCRHGMRGVRVYLGDAQNKLVAELREEYPRAEIAPAAGSAQRWSVKLSSAWKASRAGGASARSASHGLSTPRVARTARIPRGATRMHRRWPRALGVERPFAPWLAPVQATRFRSWFPATGLSVRMKPRRSSLGSFAQRTTARDQTSFSPMKGTIRR